MPADDDARKAPAGDDSRTSLIRTQREVNEELVLSALAAQEAAEASEAREAGLLATAELRERLLGIIGHDLRSPLNAMMMGADVVVARGNLGPEDEVVIRRLLQSADRMNRMIGQILDFTRARLGGGMLLELRPGTDAGQVCRAVAEELSVGTPGSLESSAQGDVTGSWDVDRLTQVISNIARNAVEHANGTAVVLDVYGDASDVCVQIRNQGSPIPPALLPFIFEPFRRARQRHPSRSGNLGLGLYIAAEIVRAHGGKLEVACAEGTTTFTLRLPRLPPPPRSTTTL